MRLNREVKVGFFGGPAGRASPLIGDFAVEAGSEDWELIDEGFDGVTEGDSPWDFKSSVATAMVEGCKDDVTSSGWF